ncbi:hypothetical protein SASPL_145093 [Salvia splendens]|uniref:Glycosyltransferase n=1 Tax=Salvia splendens TaxID=180675 RepID=A0A8X8WH02_SALSN|nr:linamarin synthase 2-like [Salvia splendens]KAG6394506.1 hypothetical protein SASPL_145093 [Salvia splendens]
MTRRPHAVLVPFPAQGHLIPAMQLASLLQTKGFFVTIVNTEFNHRRLIRSKGAEWMRSFKNLRFETMPEGLPPSDLDATQDPVALCDSIRKSCLPVFRLVLEKLAAAAEVPRISCIIADGAMSFAIRAGAELGIPVFQLWTASACGFMGYLSYRQLQNQGMVPFQDDKFVEKGLLETEIDWIPGIPNIKLRDIPSFIRTTNKDDVLFNYLRDEAQNCLQATGIIFNTFNALEHQVLEAISSTSPPTYNIGPLTMLSDEISKNQQISFKPNLWKEDRTCLEWLDKQEKNSVVYVNYGSVTLISEKHLEEFAWGLANSNHPFLLITRPDIAMGGSARLPAGFVEETKGRCLIAGWCAQDEVLLHPSVGVFLSHCGWNSTLESIGAGVPMVCWPFFAEQHTNRRFVCVEWGMGIEVDEDVRREKVEEVVREVMEGDRGKVMKGNALEWKRKAEVATRVGGESYHDFDRLVNDILSYEEVQKIIS